MVVKTTERDNKGWLFLTYAATPWGTPSGIGVGDGVVALMVEFLSSYRYGIKVRVWGYTEALKAVTR